MRNMQSQISFAIIKLITNNPLYAKDVHRLLSKNGFDKNDVRGAIANLWDQGYLNVGLNQKLYTTDLALIECP